jgi:glycosidase
MMGVIWWHVYPLGFLGAPRAAGAEGGAVAHRLPELERWLTYLVELGCDGLALGPVFESETHGYDTVDHYRIDPRLGDEADLVHLVDAARARGVRVLLDGVFNHVGRSFRGPSGWLRDGAVFEGHERLVELDHDNPEVADHVAGVMAYWLERGVAGWRLDAAYAVPLGFWRAVTDRVRERFPRAWFVGEVIHGDYAAYVEKGGLDSVTQYELWKAIWSSLNDRNFFELRWALERHNALLASFAPLTFVGNHDVTRIATRLTDPRALELALVLLFTLGGTPSVYSGDEQAFRGVKEEREGGDDAIRPAFPSGPDGLAPHGWPIYRLHQRLSGMRRRNPWLERARSRVLEITNTRLRYAVGDDSRCITVTLDVTGAPSWTIDGAAL